MGADIAQASARELGRYSNRVAYIDVLRGIGILLVAFGHSISVMDQPVNRSILSFHMPLFFFISGMLFYGKNTKGKSFWSFVKHKSFSVLVPQVTCSVLYLMFSILVYVILAKTRRVSDFITFDLLYWFLVVLFLMELVMFLGEKIRSSAKSSYIYGCCVAPVLPCAQSPCAFGRLAS